MRLLNAFNEKSLNLPVECAISLFRYRKVRPAKAVLEVPPVYVCVQGIHGRQVGHLRRSTLVLLPKHVSQNGTPETVYCGSAES